MTQKTTPSEELLLKYNNLFTNVDDSYFIGYAAFYSIVLSNKDINLEKYNITMHKLSTNMSDVSQACGFNQQSSFDKISYEELVYLSNKSYKLSIPKEYKNNEKYICIDSNKLGIKYSGFYGQYIYNKEDKIGYFVFPGSKYFDFWEQDTASWKNAFGITSAMSDFYAGIRMATGYDPQHAKLANEFVKQVHEKIINKMEEKPDVNIFTGHSLGAFQAQTAMITTAHEGVTDIKNSYYIGFDNPGTFYFLRNYFQKNKIAFSSKIDSPNKEFLNDAYDHSISFAYHINMFNNVSPQFGNVMMLNEQQNYNRYLQHMIKVCKNISVSAEDGNNHIDPMSTYFNIASVMNDVSFFSWNAQNHNLSNFDQSHGVLFTSDHA
jgi:hypothetical protein